MRLVARAYRLIDPEEEDLSLVDGTGSWSELYLDPPSTDKGRDLSVAKASDTLP